MREPVNVLIGQGDSSGYAAALEEILKSATGLPPLTTTVREKTAAGHFDVVFLTADRIGDIDLNGIADGCPVLVIARNAGHLEVIDLLQRGVSDVLAAPPTARDVLPRLWRVLRCAGHERNRKLKQELRLNRLVGASPRFAAEVRKIPLAAKCDCTVLITGETGTGKELFARAIHYLSGRLNGPFSPVNCGAIPTELVENELFGHCAGAFTGASGNRAGLIEETEDGTLFLDEIDCLAPIAQVKLLRLLQEKEYRPLGSAKTRIADVRVISSTNCGVEEAIRTGRLRRDLYYRLNVFPFSLPSLRDRKEDIPALAQHFLAKHRATLHKPIEELAPDALEALMEYDWPGNVRELEHSVERAVVLCEGESIGRAHICIAEPSSEPPSASFREAKKKMVAQFEKSYLQRLLTLHGGNISRAAKAANKNRRALFELLRKHEIRIEQFRSDVLRPS